MIAMRTFDLELESREGRVGFRAMCGHLERRSGFGASEEGSRAMRTRPRPWRFESGHWRRTHADLPRRWRRSRRLRSSHPRSAGGCRFAFRPRAMSFIRAAGDLHCAPNKAPEPTPTSVMPRAISRVAELKRWNAEPNPARVMPDAVVAHL